MKEHEIRAQYDSIGPAPNMSYAAFRKEIKLMMDPKRTSRDLEAARDTVRRKRTIAAATKRRIDRGLSEN